MPLVSYTDDDSNDSDEDDKKPFSFTNFLFGNVSEDGALEDDYLDQEAKSHLANLGSKGLNALTNQIRDVALDVGGDGESSSFKSDTSRSTLSDEEDEPLSYSPTAIDFSDFNEIGSFDESDSDSRSSITKKDLDGISERVPDTISDDALEQEPVRIEPTEIISEIPKPDTPVEEATVSGAAPNKKSLNTPLASVLPPELANIDVNDVFPDFKPDTVLRFSRLFGPGRPSSLPKRWVNFRKNTEALPLAKTSEADEEEDDDAVLEKLLEEHWPINVLRSVSGLPVTVAETETAVNTITVAEILEPDKPKRLTSAVIPPWRYGPAQYWYDFLNVDPTGENFDYGASVKKRDKTSAPPSFVNKMSMKVDVNDEAFLMVSLMKWEDNIIWDGADFKREADKIISDKRTIAGWIPNTTYRTAAAYLSQGKTTSGQPTPLDLKNDSMFPAENDELISGAWEKDIIWDAENIDELPEPAILTLDPNDPNILLGIPDEEEYETMTKEPVVLQGKEKKDMFKRSRMVLGKAGMLKEPEDTPKAPEEPKNQWKDPFNLSNDEYYSPKVDESNLKTTTGAVAIQHSVPAMQLYQYFFPTNMSNISKLRQFHRNTLKKYSNGVIIQLGPHPVESLNKIVKKRAKQREEERQASGGGEMFFMRTPEDLGVCDGELILAEYSEEHPPLLSQIGMATRIKNYFKRKPGKNDEEIPEYPYGELTLAHTSPFLGNLAPGQSLQAFENNMFRAPLYQHKLPSTDFLVIRTRNHYYIRDIRVIFTVGQECPLMEVMAPNSKKATNFSRDYLQVHIYRQFWKSTETPRRIKTDDVKKLFVHCKSGSESTVRKRLKLCAEFQRSGSESHWWILRSDFRLPTEEEIRALVPPEDYCAYHSMRSAEQRLKDAGYGEKLILATEEDGDEEQQSKMDDEIKAAPWNTTRAFIAAMKNKCILQLTGDADPTGRGEGFSYVKVANKIQEKDGPAPAKRIVTGTDADLRKLSLNNAKALLRKYGCQDDQIKKLTRWEIIDLVRTLGTQQARAGAEESMSKFARGNRYSAAEQQEKYKEECQRVFELQNRVLASEELLSTDEESSEEEEDSDLEELGRNLDSFIQSKKSSKELHFEREEEERKELKKLLNQEEAEAKILQKKKMSKKKSAAAAEEEPVDEAPAPPVRKLKIVRTFRDAEGREFDRIEFVSRPALIDAYVRLRTTKDRDFIQQFAALDSEKKEQIRREKRRLQEQLRRIKRFESDAPPSPEPPVKKKATSKKEPSLLKVKCGACGEVGHMRTNKALCSMAGEVFNVAMTKEQEDQQFGSVIEESGLVKVEGAKITLRKEVLNQTEQIRRKSLIVKIPKTLADSKASEKPEKKLSKRERKEREKEERENEADLRRPRKQRRLNEINLPDYLEKPRQTTARRRIDPVVSLASVLEEILNEMRDLPGCEPFRTPVSVKSCPDYPQYVSTPMDLSTMRTKLNNGKYKSREEFLTDVNQIVQNCSAYNGATCVLTTSARKMLDVCIQRCGEREEKFKKLEKLINPLLDDDDQVAFSFLLQQIIASKLRPIDSSTLFHTPVNKKVIKDYYDVISNPMDFDTMEQKTKSHQYQTSEQFLADIELIHANCLRYNGPDSPYTKTAVEVVRVAREALAEEADRVAGLEAAIKTTQEAAMDAAETESVGTALSESERFTQRLGSVLSMSGADLEDESRHAGMSEMGEDDGQHELAVSPYDAFDSGRDELFIVEDSTDEQPGSSQVNVMEEESISRQSPPVRKKQLRLSMGMTYYDDTRTGYEDESEHGDVTMEDANVDDTSKEQESKETPTPTPLTLATLEEDLDVSESDSDEGETKPDPVHQEPADYAEDGEEDGLWF